jgi:hypothetical protein
MQKEQMLKMTRFRLIGVALLAVLALGAMVAATAQAEPAPYFTVNGTRLVAGKTHNVTGRAIASFILHTPEQGVTIECSNLGVEKGVLLGSNEGEPGKDNEITTFSGCTVAGNGSPCSVVEPIKTNQLVSELVENVVSGAGGKQLLEEYLPASGAEFVKIKFTGTGCTVSETAVSGQVVGEPRLDNASEGKIELGQTPEQNTSWKLVFPATPIKEVWLIDGGVGKVVKIKALTAFSDSSTLTGTALTLLANTKFEPEYALWSPLP